jgi:alpha-1,2-glucosyltransferase
MRLFTDGLGDKSNHVATIHTPQMLYIWPYIAFFSLPLVVPILLTPIVRHLPEGPLKSFCLENVVGSTGSMFPSVYTLAGFIVAGVASVHYNTIIHPFTLADNRHYVFYVFRILRRNPALKYLAVPVYVTSAWVTIQTLGSRPLAEDRENPSGQKEPSISEKTRATPGRSSFILVWLATTALSVVSAPLVEPRYFIMPWLMWRLHVPSIAASPSKRSAGRTPYDMRLVLETIWHLAINTVVGYMFLHRGFLWSNEPGQIQRFLW